MQMDKTFAKVMCQAADAMVLLAAGPAALPQHPSLDLAAAANAAVQAAANRAGVGSGTTASSTSRAAAAAASSSSAGASSSRQAIGHANMLPPPGSMDDATTLQMVRGTPVSALRAWLEAESESLCVVFNCLACVTYGTMLSGLCYCLVHGVLCWPQSELSVHTGMWCSPAKYVLMFVSADERARHVAAPCCGACRCQLPALRREGGHGAAGAPDIQVRRLQAQAATVQRSRINNKRAARPT